MTRMRPEMLVFGGPQSEQTLIGVFENARIESDSQPTAADLIREKDRGGGSDVVETD